MGLPVVLSAARSRSGLRRALAAYALFALVEYATWLAVTLWAFERGGVSLGSAVAVIQLVPASLLSPALASLGDRLPRGRALRLAHSGVAGGAALTGLLLSLAAAAPLVVGAATMTTLLIAVTRPIHFAALPVLTRRADELVSANAISSASDSLALFAGPALAGFGVATRGAAAVFWASAAAATVGVLLLLRLHAEGPGSAPETNRTDDIGWRSALGGLRVLSRDLPALGLLLALGAGFVVGGALDVLGVAYSTDVLARGASGAGLLIGAVGVGGLFGSAMAGGWVRRRSLTPVVLAGGLLLGAGFACVVWLDSLLAAMLVVAGVGFGEAVMLVAGRTLLQRATDDAVLARVFAVQEATTMMGLAVGAALVPPLVRSYSVSGAFAIIGLAAAACVLLAAPLARGLDLRGTYLPRETALLAGVGFLAPLSGPALERLAARARWVQTPTGRDVIRRGDVGRDFFVVAEGQYDVLLPDGRARRLGPGDGFGEIALLRRVPRTATVTAAGPGLLLAVRDHDFLVAVTGSPDSAAQAGTTADAHLTRDLAGED